MASAYITDPRPLEDTLTKTRKEVSGQIDLLKPILDTFKESDEAKEQIARLIKALDNLRIHLEFTSNVLQTESSDKIESLKREFKNLNKEYEQIRTKGDLNTVMLQYTVEFLLDELLRKLEPIVMSCLQGDTEGSKKFIASEENVAKIFLMAHEIELITQHYPQTATFYKHDIFSYPKSGQEWKKLHEFVTFDRTNTKEDLEEFHKPLASRMPRMIYVLRNRTLGGKKLDLSNLFPVIREFIAAGKQQERAKALAWQYLTAPTEDLWKILNLRSHPWMIKLASFSLPKIGYDKCIQIPRLFPIITKEKILKEHKEKTSNKFCPETIPIQDIKKADLVKDLFVEGPNKVQIRIIAPATIDLENIGSKNGVGLIEKVKNATCGRNVKKTEELDAIIIHIHGGAWSMHSSAVTRVYLYRWTNTLNTVAFSLDYRLSPTYKHPDQLDDIWQAYLWIANYAETVLGIKYKKIILSGDSAGGSLAAAVTTRLVRAGLQPPHGLYLIYPGNCNRIGISTPSRFLSLTDYVLPYGMLDLAYDSYVPKELQDFEDPYTDPSAISDELIEKFPPTRIAIGTADPLLDDCWRTLARFAKQKKDVRMTVYENVPHAFFNLNYHHNYEYLCQTGLETVKELASKKVVEQKQ